MYVPVLKRQCIGVENSFPGPCWKSCGWCARNQTSGLEMHAWSLSGGTGTKLDCAVNAQLASAPRAGCPAMAPKHARNGAALLSDSEDSERGGIAALLSDSEKSPAPATGGYSLRPRVRPADEPSRSGLSRSRKSRRAAGQAALRPNKELIV